MLDYVKEIIDTNSEYMEMGFWITMIVLGFLWQMVDWAKFNRDYCKHLTYYDGWRNFR